MSIGNRIEEMMNSMMEISGYVADQSSEINRLNRSLNMYKTLFDVNKYMNMNLELSNLLPLVEDAMKATIGVNEAIVLISDHDKENKINNNTINIKDIDNLDIDDFVYFENLKEQPLSDLNVGSVFINKLELMSGVNGYLLAYWHMDNAVDDDKLAFLKILSVQTALSIKSSLLMEQLIENSK